MELFFCFNSVLSSGPKLRVGPSLLSTGDDGLGDNIYVRNTGVGIQYIALYAPQRSLALIRAQHLFPFTSEVLILVDDNTPSLRAVCLINLARLHRFEVLRSAPGGRLAYLGPFH